MKEQWSRGVFQKEHPQQSAEANAAALAQVDLLTKLLEIDETEIEEALLEAQRDEQ